MNKVILADSQAIFRAGTAKVLAMDEDLRIIAQCTDLDRMMHAITTFPGSIVVFAASLRPDMARLRTLLEDLLQERDAPAAAGAGTAALGELARHPRRVQPHPVHELAPRNMEAITHLVVQVHRGPSE